MIIAKRKLSEKLGTPNSYSGSADWAGATVWTVSGDKFTGIFVVIDDNDNVVLIDRSTNEVDEYVDEELFVARTPEELDKLIEVVGKYRK